MSAASRELAKLNKGGNGYGSPGSRTGRALGKGKGDREQQRQGANCSRKIYPTAALPKRNDKAVAIKNNNGRHGQPGRDI